MIKAMRVEYKELMDKLGVGYELSPYETRPWYMYDSVRGIACSAEVRVGPGAEDVEAEIQFLYDDREEGEEETGGEEGGDSGPRPQGVVQMLLLRVMPFRDKLWTPTLFVVKGENFTAKIYDWESRGCQFFQDCIQAIQMDELPNIDDMIDNDLDDAKGGRGKRGRVGKKAPKVNPAALMGMKR